MSEAPRTHRDTLALILTMFGTMTCALVPVAKLARDQDYSPAFVRLATLVLGCALGAGLAASARRTVSLATAGVAGALQATLLTGATSYMVTARAPALDVLLVGTAVAAALAGVIGAAAGLRSRRTLAAPAAAAIALGAPMVVFLVLGVLRADGLELHWSVVAALLVAAPAGGGALGAAMHHHVTANQLWVAMFWMVFVVAIVGLVRVDAIVVAALAGALTATGVACVAIVGFLAVRAWQRPRVDVEVPTARVVDR